MVCVHTQSTRTSKQQVPVGDKCAVVRAVESESWKRDAVIEIALEWHFPFVDEMVCGRVKDGAQGPGHAQRNPQRLRVVCQLGCQARSARGCAVVLRLGWEVGAEQAE